MAERNVKKRSGAVNRYVYIAVCGSERVKILNYSFNFHCYSVLFCNTLLRHKINGVQKTWIVSPLTYLAATMFVVFVMFNRGQYKRNKTVYTVI